MADKANIISFIGWLAATAIIAFIVGVGCYSAGYSAGQRDYQAQYCIAYPFLLVDPSQYWACQRLNPQP